MRYKNLILVGTSHIAKQSLEEVSNTIKEENPDILALELDIKRFRGLTEDKKRNIRIKDIRRVGLKGFIFSLVGAWVEKKLGKIVGVKPGSEMINAVNLAKKRNIRIALIDQDIEITLRNISKEFSWKERFNFVKDIIKGIIFRKNEMKKLGIEKIDLTKVPPKKIIKKLTSMMKKKYPNLYKVLVEERNYVMASNLKRIMEDNPDKLIMAVVGAGHKEGLIKILKSKMESSKNK